MLTKRTVIPLAVALGITIVAVAGASATAFLASNGGPATGTALTIAGDRLTWFDVIDIPLFLIAATTLPGVITYLLTRRDFRPWVAVLATAVCVILVALGSWIGFVFAFFAFFGAPVVYLGMRYLLKARPSLTLATSTVALLGGLTLAAAWMSYALDAMG